MISHKAGAILALLMASALPVYGNTPWDADYFPNVELTTHEGKKVRFFELIENKVVAINFIYTICPDSCPLETARLAKVQSILGDRVGKDIFMYSITIDPENDTPEVLAKYRERFGVKPGWWFLTGKEDDIILLRRKLGLYIEEIQDGSNNHNLNLIIGNQSTGRWMKRSPFENPYVLATQMGSWLSGWKAPPEADFDYADAPEVRNISQGEYLFRTRCSTCHTVGKGTEGLPEGLEGPDLLGVTKRREKAWLERWISEPDAMLAEKDPLAMGLFAKYNELPMPNMRLSAVDVKDVIRYLKSETNRVEMDRARERRRKRRSDPSEAVAPAETAVEAETAAAPSGDAVAIMNAWIREAHPDAPVNAGYMTLINIGPEDVTLVGLESPAFEKVEIHEMARVDGLMKMRELTEVTVPSGGQTRFEPGGSHLMLMGPHLPLTKGQGVELTMIFRSGRRQVVSVRVVDR